MNQLDSAVLQALRNIGTGWAGQPGYGQYFGAIPNAQAGHPGQAMIPGGTFFAPQIHSPYNFQPVSGAFGTFAGMAAQGFMAQQGYTYMPPGVSPMAVMMGRAQEQRLIDATGLGRGFDEYRMARALESALRGTMGHGAAAYANAAVASMPIQAAMPFLSQFIPGGSAESFARQFSVTGQMMRDYTQDRYGPKPGRGPFKLGLPGDESQRMIARLMDFFQPGGSFDYKRTSGLEFGEIGQLGRSLSGFGLLDSDVSQKDISAFASEAGVGVPTAGSADLEKMRNQTRTIKIGRQLQGYAEVVRSVREILGDPKAPIRQVIDELDQLTHGTFQQMNIPALQQNLRQLTSMSYATGIAPKLLSQMTISGANDFAQRGLNPIVGGQVAQQAAAMTVASQVSVSGSFAGRLNPQQEYEARYGLLARAGTSPSARVSSQALMLLDTMDPAALSGSERRTYASIRSRANQLGFNENNMSGLISDLGRLGVGRSRAYTSLMSTAGVSDYLAGNAHLQSAAWRGGVNETIDDVTKTVRGWYSALGDDDLRTELRRAGRGVGGVNKLLGLVGQSFGEMTTGSADDMRKVLQGHGVNTTGLNVEAMMLSLSNDDMMKYNIRGRNVKDIPGLVQLLSKQRNEAGFAVMGNQESLSTGARLISKLGLSNVGTTGFQRFVGGMMDGGTTVMGALAKGFGFTPSNELVKQVDETVFKKFKENVSELTRLQKAPAGSRDEAKISQLKAEIQGNATALQGMLANSPGADQTMHIQRLLAPLEDEQDTANSKAYKSVIGGGGSVQNMKRLANMFGKWTTASVDAATRGMDDDSADLFKGNAAMLQQAGLDIANLEKELASGKGRSATEINKEILRIGGAFEQYGPGAVEALRGIRSGISSGAAFGQKPSISGQVKLLNEANNALDAFMVNSDRNTYIQARERVAALTSGGFILNPGTEDEKINTELIDQMVYRQKGLTSKQRELMKEQLTKDISDALQFSKNDVADEDYTEDYGDKIKEGLTPYGGRRQLDASNMIFGVDPNDPKRMWANAGSMLARARRTIFRSSIDDAAGIAKLQQRLAPFWQTNGKRDEKKLAALLQTAAARGEVSVAAMLDNLANRDADELYEQGNLSKLKDDVKLEQKTSEGGDEEKKSNKANATIKLVIDGDPSNTHTIEIVTSAQDGGRDAAKVFQGPPEII